jgi:beta-glucosidase
MPRSPLTQLPVTMYPHSYINEQPLTNYDMSLSPGRTYRYYENEPLYPFGHGLSYTDFELDCKKGEGMVDCEIANTGDVDGDEVVFVYHSVGNEIRKEKQVLHPIPIKSLVDFDRISLKAGEKGDMTFKIDNSTFETINEDGEKVVYEGQHNLIFGRGHGKDVVLSFIVGGN